MLAVSHELIGLAVFGDLLFSSAAHAAEPLRIDVLAATGFPISGKDDHRLQGATVTVYAVAGLVRFELALSRGLPAEAESAAAKVLRRVVRLNPAGMAPVKEPAIGLVKAAQYGIDRYPAVVLNGTAVVYGVTDLVDAVERYRAWRRNQSR